MMFGANQWLKKVKSRVLYLKYNATPIAIAKIYKYLGIARTKLLSTFQHLAKAIKKVSSKIYLLRKIWRSCMDAKTTNVICQSLIVSLLTYGSLSLYGSKSDLYQARQVDKIEARAQVIFSSREIWRRNKLAYISIINLRSLIKLPINRYIFTQVLRERKCFYESYQ